MANLLFKWSANIELRRWTSVILRPPQILRNGLLSLHLWWDEVWKGKKKEADLFKLCYWSITAHKCYLTRLEWQVVDQWGWSALLDNKLRIVITRLITSFIIVINAAATVTEKVWNSPLVFSVCLQFFQWLSWRVTELFPYKTLFIDLRCSLFTDDSFSSYGWFSCLAWSLEICFKNWGNLQYFLCGVWYLVG